MGNHLYNDFLTWPVKSGKAHVALVILVATPLYGLVAIKAAQDLPCAMDHAIHQFTCSKF